MVRYDRNAGTYTLMIPSTTDSFLLGNETKTRQYFWSIGMEVLGERAMDAARNFQVSQALVAERRAFGLDLTKGSFDVITRERDRKLSMQRALGTDEDDDEEVL